MKKEIKTGLCALVGAAALAVAPMQAVHANAQQQPRLYDLEEILTPVWEGDTCYQESVLPVMRGGEDVTVSLLYPATEIIKVQNANLTVTYEKGVDYDVVDGELLVYSQGAIHGISYMEFHPTAGQFPNVEDGGYLCFHEGAYFHDRQIVVTYKHKTKYKGYIPKNKGQLLPKLHSKLQEGETLDLFVLGDSISVGANSSGFSEINVSPYMPIYPQLFADGLRQQYGLNSVNVYNHSVGGKDSAWGVSQIESVLASHENVDLAVIAFGMNDGGLSPTAFCANLQLMINAVHTKFPNAEILLVAPMLPNPKSSYNKNQSLFAAEMETTFECEGIAVANMTAVHGSLLSKKSYADMTGNNINHPNDYLARVYAQTLLTTVKKADEKPNGAQRGCGATMDSALCMPILAALAFALKSKTCKKQICK